MKKEKINALVGLTVLIISFITISYLIQINSDYINSLISKIKVRDFAIVFVILLVIGTVFVPISVLPIIPLATYSYGWIQTGMLILIGEFIGALISFGISRKYGLPLVSKLISLEEIQKYEKVLPEGNVFWVIVLIRIALPVDVLSYVLGLFEKIKFQTFAFATLLGLIPGAFALSYVGSLEPKYQVIAFIMAVLVILIGYGIDVRYKIYKKRKQEALAAKLISQN
ncbi:MAG: VTT domain-containing protein [Nanoarchaeota archaeon]|mgnify:CR=1 FL=1